MELNIKNETSKLKAVVLGQSKSMGDVPTLQSAFDAKSYETILNGIYPNEVAISREMGEFEKVLLKHDVQVFRPWILENCNQVYARDVGFVIDDKIIISNIIPDREDEKQAYELIFSQLHFSKINNLPEKAHVEGGDIVLMNDTVFVGVYTGTDYSNLKTARTNIYAFNFLKEIFPRKTFVPLELIKDDTNPRQSVLHLDCAFMPVGRNKAIIYKEGFLIKNDYYMLIERFGRDNVFEITQAEMYEMNTNVFSISPDVVVSESNFKRLNSHMENNWGLTVEKVPYHEISKMGGLLRCSTLPLLRED